MKQLVIGLLTLLSAWSFGDYRYYLINQSDWSKNLGFYVDIESNGHDVANLDDANLILGVADGRTWDYQRLSGLKIGPNRVEITLSRDQSTISLAGKIASSSHPIKLIRTPVLYDFSPSWASGPSHFHIELKSYRLEAADKTLDMNSGTGQLAKSDARFFTSIPNEIPGWQASSGSFPIKLSVEIDIKAGDSTPFPTGPVMDQFGQILNGDYPGKIHSVEDLKQAKLQEDQDLRHSPASAGQDRFGGKLGTWSVPGTGYYQVIQRNGVWTFISPEGHPLFYSGICDGPMPLGDSTPVTGRESMFSALPDPSVAGGKLWNFHAWGANDGSKAVSFYAWNLFRRDGINFDTLAVNRATKRLKSWGFTGWGKWSDGTPGVPYCKVIWYQADSPARHPDIYDPAIQTQIRTSLAKLITPLKSDPYLLGWSIKNEYDEVILTTEIQEILKQAPGSLQRSSLLARALTRFYGNRIDALNTAWGTHFDSLSKLQEETVLNPPAAELEKLRQTYAQDYYQFLYQTVKTLDPNHLYFGYWIVPGWWQNDADWALIAPYCDVIGYDRYSAEYADDHLLGLIEAAKKPVLLGEYSFPPHFNGQRGFGQYFDGVPTEEDAAKATEKLLLQAAASHYCVGAFWFEYEDEPISGRGPGQGQTPVLGENYAFGLVDVGDRPKMPLIEMFRRVNPELTELKLKATKSR